MELEYWNLYTPNIIIYIKRKGKGEKDTKKEKKFLKKW
jgi:hypothetical protein